MRAPRPKDSAITQARKNVWLADFVGYRTPVNQGRIEAWLQQFKEHSDLGARVLDAVEFYGSDRISNAFRTSLGAIPGWHADPTQRTGRWFFSPMSSTAGDSGGTMLHLFRLANRMAKKQYNDLFVFPSQLVQRKLTAEDTVVLIDDFIGTGKQASDSWKSDFSELVAGAGTVYLMVVAATQLGRQRVQEETDLVVHSAHELHGGDNIFSDGCTHFEAAEKKTLMKYCRRADKKEPEGFGSCGLIVVFAHRCPDDSIPILHADHPRWRGLFPRDG